MCVEVLGSRPESGKVGDKMVVARKKPARQNPPRTHNTERSLSTAHDTAAKIRAIRAVELVSRGYTYDEVASELGYSGRGAAFGAVQRLLDQQQVEAVDNLRKLHNIQIKRSLRLVDAKIEAGGSDALWAMDRQIHLLERQAKLNGLDITRDEIMSAMPYQKRILLDDSPAELPALPTPEVSPRQLQAGPVVLSDEEPGL